VLEKEDTQENYLKRNINIEKKGTTNKGFIPLIVVCGNLFGQGERSGE
jgi:hypothetical protein